MSEDAVRTIPADHPALAGHFPGDPIVPGVVLLECVFDVARERFGIAEPARLHGVKFLSPLRPGQPFSIRVEPCAGGRVRFVCAIGDRLLARGEIAARR